MESYLKYRCVKGEDNSGITVIGYELGKDTGTENQLSLGLMRIIASMNVGKLAVLVADLMRSVDSLKFEWVLVTGYSDKMVANIYSRLQQQSRLFASAPILSQNYWCEGVVRGNDWTPQL